VATVRRSRLRASIALAGQAARLKDFKIPVGFALALLWYILIYLRSVHTPGISEAYPLGWIGWWDQGKYYESAIALSQFDFSAARHWYLPLYSLFAAPFYPLMGKHLFLIPNLAAFAFILVGLYRIFIAVQLARWEAYVLIVVTVLIQAPVMLELVTPWTSIPVQALTYCALYCLLLRRRGNRDYFAAAACVAAVLMLRPLSVVPIAVPFVLRLVSDRRSILRPVAVSTAICGCAIAAVLLWNWAIYGTLATPYLQATALVGFTPSAIPKKLVLVLIDPSSAYVMEAKSLLNYFPWMITAVPGFFFLARRLPLATAGLGGAVVSTVIIHCAYNDFTTRSIFTFRLIHYILWIVPIVGLFCYVTFRNAVRAMHPALFSTFLMLPTVTVAMVGLQPTPSRERFEIIEVQKASNPEARLVKLDGKQLTPFYGYYDYTQGGGIERLYFRKSISARKIEIDGIGSASASFFRLRWFAPGMEGVRRFFRNARFRPWRV
jgi:hypothetical protein